MWPKGQPKRGMFARRSAAHHFEAIASAGSVRKGAIVGSKIARLTVNQNLFKDAYCRKAFLYGIQLHRQLIGRKFSKEAASAENDSLSTITKL